MLRAVDYNEQQKEILSALIGLGRAAEGNKNRPTESTDCALLQGFAYLSEQNLSEIEVRQLAKQLEAEKYRLVPRCLSCEKQCGRNHDFNYAKSEFTDEIAEAKSELLSAILSLAAETAKLPIPAATYRGDLASLYDALFYLGSEKDLQEHETVTARCLHRLNYDE